MSLRATTMSFGDFDHSTNKVNDKIASDNGDMRKVLKTVASTLEAFFKEHPDKIVHVTGSDQTRNDYYQKLVKNYGDKIAKDVTLIYGSSSTN